jgi:hypothetical protein
MKIGNEIDHLGTTLLEVGYARETGLRSWLRTLCEAIAFTAVVSILIFLVALLQAITG